jgi:hypothetical protein
VGCRAGNAEGPIPLPPHAQSARSSLLVKSPSDPNTLPRSGFSNSHASPPYKAQVSYARVGPKFPTRTGTTPAVSAESPAASVDCLPHKDVG